MKYINLFDTQAAYDAAEKYYPNVSYVEATDEVVYQEIDPDYYSKEYFTTEALESGTFSCALTVQYSIDGGTTWEVLKTNNSLTVAQGDNVMWKCEASWNNRKFNSTCRFNAYGNVMSLMYGDNFIGQTTFPAGDNFQDGLFYQNNKLVSAENLILPVTTMTSDCYKDMFYGCTLLTTAPSILPATTLESNCYKGMFYGCTSLTTAPELPATTLASNCYYEMFRGCTSLATAPELPATTLVYNCYYGMFMGCTSLTTAPELPATRLAPSCYDLMFKDCTNLNYIKAMFTNTPGEYNGTRFWVLNVAATGTFVKNSAATWNVSGDHGIPTGWTVETATA